MLGKVVVAALTRKAAATALIQALDETAILGLQTNVGFLRSIVDSAAFRDGRIDTAWLDTVWLAENAAGTGPPVPQAAWYLAAWALATAAGPVRPGPLTATDGWRLAGPSTGILVQLSEPGDTAVTRLLRVDPISSSIDVDGDTVGVRQVSRDGTSLWLEVQGRLEFGHVVIERHAVHVAYQGQAAVFGRPDPFGPDARRVVQSGSLAAPMPGTVLAVHVGVGDAVEAGETLAVMEAMKMELALKAPFAGTVASVAVSAGDRVDLGAQLVVVDPAEAAGP
jgi:3-methylcrotonyl-CoA carboxylase alpha subunit/acetyl-CoA/propionyl-CoA carboxylase biotin carboxyl carrier protein